MNTITVSALLALSIVAGAGTYGTADEKDQVTYRGEFLGRRVAIGGETTGWAMRYHAADGDQVIELDIKPEVAGRFKAGDRVGVTGRLTERDYVERGTVKVLVVTTMERDNRDK